MKRYVEAVLVVLLAVQSSEVAWRRLVWKQLPPELPTWLWGALLACNGLAIAWSVRRWRKAPAAAVPWER